MAPSVFDLYANWSKSGGEEEREDWLVVLHNQPLKELHDDENQCYGLIVIKTELEGLLCYEYNGCGLETHWKMLKTSKSSPTQFKHDRVYCPARTLTTLKIFLFTITVSFLKRRYVILCFSVLCQAPCFSILPKEKQGAWLTLQELLNLKLAMKHNLYVTVVNLTDVIFHAAMQLKGLDSIK